MSYLFSDLFHSFSSEHYSSSGYAVKLINRKNRKFVIEDNAHLSYHNVKLLIFQTNSVDDLKVIPQSVPVDQ